MSLIVFEACDVSYKPSSKVVEIRVRQVQGFFPPQFHKLKL